MNPVTDLQLTPIDFGGGIYVRWINPTDAGFDHVKILRKTTNDISGPSDPSGTVIFTGAGAINPEYRPIVYESPLTKFSRFREVLDLVTIGWDTTYYYAVFAMNAAENDVSVAANQSTTTPPVPVLEELDVLGLVLDYLKSGLAKQVADGVLKVKAGTSIDVLDATPQFDPRKFPIVSVHLDMDTAEYVLGDSVGYLNEDGGHVQRRRGYLSHLTLSIIGWAGDNPEVRRSLYRALKGLMLGIRSILEAKGVSNPDVKGHFAFDDQSYAMPMYSANFVLTGTINSSISATQSPFIADFDVSQTTVSLVSQS